MELQAGTVRAIYNNQRTNPLYRNPALQITGLSKLQMGDTDKLRYKANVSDGQHYMKAVFASELTQYIENSTIKKYTLIRIPLFTVRPKESSNYLYIQTVSQHESRDSLLGQPVSIVTGKPSTEHSLGAEYSNNETVTHTTFAPGSKGAVATPAASKNSGDAYLQNGMSKQPSIAKQVNPNFPAQQHSSDMRVGKRPSLPSDESKKQRLNIIPIKDLNPFVSRWAVRGRVMSKTELKTFTSSRGDGKVFSFEISDGTAQIKVAAFHQAAETFYPVVELNRVYTVSAGTIKMANKRWASTNFDYEIQLEKNSEVVLVEEDDKSIPKYHFEFIKASDLTPGSSLVDFVGVVKDVFPVGMIKSKTTGKDLSKRDLVLVDETGSVRLTIWGPRAEEEYSREQVLCLKSVKVGEYNGAINLATTASSQIIYECDVPEAIKVLAWYNENRDSIQPEKPRVKTERVRLIKDLKDGVAEYGTVNCTVLFLREDGMFYEACLSENCGRKVVEAAGDGNYTCEHCGVTHTGCQYRYMLSMQVGDFSGQVWVTLFNDAAQGLIGMDADSLRALGDENHTELLSIARGVALGEYTMRLRVKQQMYNGEPRLRFTCVELRQRDPVSEASRMLTAIERVQ